MLHTLARRDINCTKLHQEVLHNIKKSVKDITCFFLQHSLQTEYEANGGGPEPVSSVTFKMCGKMWKMNDRPYACIVNSWQAKPTFHWCFRLEINETDFHIKTVATLVAFCNLKGQQNGALQKRLC